MTLVLLIAINYFFQLNLAVVVVFIAIVFSAGVYFSNYALANKYFSSKDPQCIVIDEVVGMFVACIPILTQFRKESLISFVVAFLAFRFFDITKWYLVKKMEDFPRGWGIMLDDLVAGLFCWVIVIPVDLMVAVFSL